MTFDELTGCLDHLRVRPLTLEIPFKQTGRHVHFYLIEDSRPALVDTGLYTEANEKWLGRALAKHGYELGDIKRVFLTHGHIDHYGNARPFQERGAEVFLHPADFNKVMPLAPAEKARLVSLYRAEIESWGFPGELVGYLDTVLFGGDTFANYIDEPTPVRDGDSFAFDRFDLKVFEVPGHTPGCVAYYFGDTGVAVTGDHLLHGISPNPLFELDASGRKIPSLVRYFDSLTRIIDNGLRLGLPAHGPFVRDARELAASMNAFYERRQKKLFGMLDEPASAFALVQTYYRRLKGFEMFLGFSEILGNLEMMVHRGEIAVDERGGARLFRRLRAEPIPFPAAA